MAWGNETLSEVTSEWEDLALEEVGKLEADLSQRRTHYDEILLTTVGGMTGKAETYHGA